MYAIIKTGGKQYRVQEGDEIFVEKLEVEAGTQVELSEVLLVADGDNVKVGNPYVAGAKVVATASKHGKSSKVLVFKYKPKKGYKRLKGHRQPFTKLTIETINA